MQLESVLSQLRKLKADFPQMNIRRMAVFGSVARRQERPDSDVDLLVEFTQTPDFFELHKIKTDIEVFLKTPVDVVTFSSLRTPRQKKILQEAVDV